MLQYWGNSYRFALWTPAQITTALWLDAGDSSTVSTVSGAANKWNDKSGNSRNLTQSNTASRPLYLTNQVNGLSALSFDGTNDFMINSSVGLPVGASARTVYVVYKPLRTTTGEQNYIFSQSENAGSSGAWFAMLFLNIPSSSLKGDPYFAGYAADLSDGTTPTAVTKIGSINYTGSTGNLKRNGTSIASGSLSLNTTDNVFRVGVSPNLIAYGNMLLCELIFLAFSASTTTEQIVEGYLAWKWGLQAALPAGHPYKSAAPTV